MIRSAIILAVLFFAPTILTATEKVRNVLVFHSYHQGLGWTDGITRGIKNVLNQEPVPSFIHYEYMDTKRNFNDRYLDSLHTLYRIKYKKIKFDVIISSDDHAFRFLLKNKKSLFPGVPVVFCGVNYFQQSYINDKTDYTGIVESFSISGTIDGALKINPDIKRVYVAVDSSVTGRANRKLVEAVIPAYKDRLRFSYISNMSMEEVEDQVSNLPENSIVLISSYTLDRLGKTYTLEESADIITGASNRPVYGFWDFYLNHGVMGGKLTTGISQGEKAAELAVRIMKGERPSDIPVITKSPNRYIYDFNVMEKYNITEAMLPEGSMVINRPLSFYEENRKVFWQILLVICILSIFSIALIINLLRRRTAEIELQESEIRFRDLAELLPETIYEMDLDGKIIYANKSGLEKFNYAHEEVERGVHISRVIADDYLDILSENTSRIIEGEVLGLNEYVAVKKDGTRFPVMARSSAIVRDGVVQGLRGFLIDISERKKLEEQMQSVQRLESIGTLAGGIAHDFNNILAGIQGHIDLLEMQSSLTPGQGEHVELIHKLINSASNLTSQLLGFARAGKYDPKSTDINILVSETLEMFGRTKKQLRIDLSLYEKTAASVIDRGQIEQVLVNLFVNAWQAMPEGGDLKIRTGLDKVSSAASKNMEIEKGHYVTISVTDSGVGMDSETQNRIFEPFFSTKSRGRGTGLGLASAYGIAKNHGGTITVESESGKGSTFTLYLPLTEEDPHLEKKDQKKIKHGTETILLIDDEEMICTTGSRMLKHLGYEVITATGGRDGVEIFRKDPDAIDLIILDIVMPDMNGKETFMRLIDEKPEVKVLLSSGYSIDGEASEILSSGSSSFIQKPFNINELSNKIREILDF